MAADWTNVAQGIIAFAALAVTSCLGYHEFTRRRGSGQLAAGGEPSGGEPGPQARLVIGDNGLFVGDEPDEEIALQVVVDLLNHERAVDRRVAVHATPLDDRERARRDRHGHRRLGDGVAAYERALNALVRGAVHYEYGEYATCTSVTVLISLQADGSER